MMNMMVVVAVEGPAYFVGKSVRLCDYFLHNWGKFHRNFVEDHSRLGVYIHLFQTRSFKDKWHTFLLGM